MICKIKDALYNSCDKDVIIWGTHMNAPFALYNGKNSKVELISPLLIAKFSYLCMKAFF